MLGKLAIRNVKRSAKDYLVYCFTMMLVTALMFAFDVQIYSGDVQEDFASQLAVIEEHSAINEAYSYCIYQKGTNELNIWLYTHLKVFDGGFLKEDGRVDWEMIEKMHGAPTAITMPI